ncbi:LON peptidase substrate-binding domain-containing protein [Undibacterium sp.]|jgi:Lon protease-like protein|uniref:LON peptidase substrate-binding domain-containing protein n=1 Tax=Undibacterium sp. TaxID=1914977 RepID=UPI002C4DC8DC|nr:LON peptidase substrate-binding domain-containing protein [Undibacterium sp.]HTD06283.1 LON peptidase substrate-binding domain-containing protein [Undibacterium sp.]
MSSRSIPLFPLRTVLFPDGLLPLQVFEVRYLDMIGKCIASQSEFGIVSLAEGSEVRKLDGKEVLAPVGTVAKIDEWGKPQPGLIRINCIGGERFRILSSEQLKHGLWVAEVESLEDDHSIPIPQELQITADMLQSLITALQKKVGEGGELPMRPPYRLNDCGWVANRWCELLPIALTEKQHLLALDNPLVRLELVQDLLDQLGLTESV